MPYALETVKNQFLEYAAPSIQFVEIVSDWWPTVYAVWEKANFSTATCKDLYTYLQIISVIPLAQRPLFEKQIWSLQELNQPELSIRLKAMIYFANHFREHQFEIFQENEIIPLSELWMAHFDEAWLDIQLATRKSLKEVIVRTNKTQFYDFYQEHIVSAHMASIRRFQEALVVFNQASQSLPWYAYHYFLEEYLSYNLSACAPLQQAVEVFGLSLERKFERLQYRCLSACTASPQATSCASLFRELDKVAAISLTPACLERFWADYIQHKHIQTSSALQQAVAVYQHTQSTQFVGTRLGEILLSESLTQARIAYFQHFMTCLQQYIVSPTMINALFDAFQKNSQIRAPTVLHQVIKIGQQLHSAAFVGTSVSQQFFNRLQTYTQAEINELQLFLNTVAPHGLSPEAIDVLFKYFRASSRKQLNEAIHIMKLAIKLSTRDDLLRQHFYDLNTKKTERIMLMRYLYHGLLDFLGEDFREKCLNQHEELYVSSSQGWVSGATSKRENFACTSVWHSVMRDMMQEFGGILRKPIESSDFRANAFVFCVPKHHEFFQVHQKNYERFGLSINALRRRQAKGFFNELKKVKAHEKDPQHYYTQIFEKIFATQQRIIRKDQRLNQTRWFFKLNTKGYSRLYDITNQILREMLQHYHQAVAHGSIKPEQYRDFQEALNTQLFIQVKYLADGLPEKHSLRRRLMNISRKEGAGILRNLLQKEQQVPKHLHYLVENIRSYLVFNEEAESTRSFHHSSVDHSVDIFGRNG